MKELKGIFFFAVCITALSCVKPAGNSKKNISIGFYNVENLFDIYDDTSKLDNDFLPESEKEWTSDRYQTKLIKLADVISELGDSDGPEILGLCEVENKQVVENLASTTKLKSYGYKIIHEDSPDKRGIDVCLIFKESFFKVIKHQYHTVNFKDEEIKTRDFLHVTGILKSDTINLIVNHWPSRRGGQTESEWKRIKVAAEIKSLIDSLNLANQNLLIMGDFNDMPDNKSLTETLKAGPDSTFSNNMLFNTSYMLHKMKKGTYCYKGDWNMLDQLIISKPMYNNLYIHRSSSIFSPEWLKQNNGDKYDGYPNRTYGGNKYLGGYSDHFPVFLHLKTR